MFLLIAAILVVVWLVSFLVLHVTSALIHILLVIAVIAFVVHFIRGRRTS